MHERVAGSSKPVRRGGGQLGVHAGGFLRDARRRCMHAPRLQLRFGESDRPSVFSGTFHGRARSDPKRIYTPWMHPTRIRTPSETSGRGRCAPARPFRARPPSCHAARGVEGPTCMHHLPPGFGLAQLHWRFCACRRGKKNPGGCGCGRDDACLLCCTCDACGRGRAVPAGARGRGRAFYACGRELRGARMHAWMHHAIATGTI